MAQPFVAEKGVLRLSPLEKAVAARVSQTGGAGVDVASVMGGGSASAADATQLPPGVTPEQVAEAQAKAANGDQSAIDWLKTIGLIGGAAGTGYAIHRVLSGRGSKKTSKFGAGDIGDAATSTSTSKAPKALPAQQPMKLLPAPAPKPETVIVPPNEQTGYGVIQQPGTNNNLQHQDFYEARRQRTAPKSEGQQFTDFYNARRAREAIKAIRKLP